MFLPSVDVVTGVGLDRSHRAVIDFETCGVADPACDLFPA
jgi:aminoglycoside phosphotransferase (APT) family kinase protein